MVSAIKYARTHNIPFLIIGNGSNVLVSDKGVKGLVIKNTTSNIKIHPKPAKSTNLKTIEPRYQPLEKYSDTRYDESKFDQVSVTLDSGVFLPRAIFSLINQGVTGLEWFAGIPATIGGACFINLHGADKYFSDYLIKAKLLTKDNQIKSVSSDYFNFGYDDSTLKTSGDIVLSATLNLLKGPQDIAIKIAKNWAEKKSHQPQVSAGCIFQNLSATEQRQLKLPTSSIGYLMDQVLHLKGTTVGQAKISETHAGFIENLGEAKASDIVKLIDQMKSSAKKTFDLDLKLEIVMIGF